MKIEDKRFTELAERMDALDQDLDELKDKRYFTSRVALAMQEILDTNQAMCIKHYIDGKEVETRLLRDKLKELKIKRMKLEQILEDIDKQLEIK